VPGLRRPGPPRLLAGWRCRVDPAGEEDALERAEAECLTDAEARARRRERERSCRAEYDLAFQAEVAKEVVA